MYHLTLCVGSGPMQVPGLFDMADKRGKYGLVHNVGLGGAVVVTILRRPEFYKPGGLDGRARFVYLLHKLKLSAEGDANSLGYNHAHECRPISMKDVDRVKSKKASKYVLQHAKL